MVFMKRYEPRMMCLSPETIQAVKETLWRIAETSHQELSTSLMLHFMDGTNRGRKAEGFTMYFPAGCVVMFLGKKLNTEHYLVSAPDEYWVIVEVRHEAIWYLFGDLYQQ
jgi:hypothetical protein